MCHQQQEAQNNTSAACLHHRPKGNLQKPSSCTRSPLCPRAAVGSHAPGAAQRCSCIFQGDRCSQAPRRHNDCIGLDAETGWGNGSEAGIIDRALGKLGIIYNLTYNLLLKPGGLKWLDISVPLEKGAGWERGEKQWDFFFQLQNPGCLKSPLLRF